MVLCLTDVTFFFQLSPLSFDNGGTDCNADYCINTVDENITKAINLVNFGPVIPKTLWLICTDGESTSAKIRCALVFKVIR